MNWVHCNKCFITKAENVSLFCGSCCHILCQNCIQSICPFCGKDFNNINIAEKLPTQISTYFADILKSTERLQKSIKFQWEHRTRIEAIKVKVIFPRLIKLQAERKTITRSVKILEDNVEKEILRIQKMQAYLTQQKILEKVRASQISRSLISSPTLGSVTITSVDSISSHASDNPSKSQQISDRFTNNSPST